MYGLKQNIKGADSYYDQYKEKVHDAIDHRKIWWLQECEKNTYLRTEGVTANTFFKECLNNNGHLKKLLVGTPEDFLDIIKALIASGCKTLFQKPKVRVKNKLSDKNLSDLKKSEIAEAKLRSGGKLTDEEKESISQKEELIKTKAIEDFNGAVGKVFVDELYETKLDKKSFVKSLNLRICPYCGRNYIFNVDIGSRTIKPQIDHFLAKREFPFLAISYYNMIPSCTVCNVDVKGTTVPLNDTYDAYTIPHPYSYVDEWKFIFKLNGIDLFSNLIKDDIENIEIGYEGKLSILDEHEKLFAIKTLYKEHTDMVHELIIKKQFWASDASLEYYTNILGMDRELSAKMSLAILGFTDDPGEAGKRPFIKLLKDISDYYDKLVKRGKSLR